MFKTTTILIVLTLAVVLTMGSLIVSNERCGDNNPASTPVCSTALQQPGGQQANVWRGFPFAYATPGGLEVLPLLGSLAFWFAAVLLGWFLLTLLRIFIGRALDYNFERLRSFCG